MNGKTAKSIVGLGAVAGMRSMLAPALVAHVISTSDPRTLQGSRLRWLGQQPVATLFKVAVVGEMVVDKMPFMPNRVDLGPMAGRMASGALVGATIARLRNDSPGAGAVLGAAAAAVGALAAYHARRALSQDSGLSDTLVAVGEDALALAAGASLAAHSAAWAQRKPRLAR